MLLPAVFGCVGLLSLAICQSLHDRQISQMSLALNARTPSILGYSIHADIQPSKPQRLSPIPKHSSMFVSFHGRKQEVCQETQNNPTPA